MDYIDDNYWRRSLVPTSRGQTRSSETCWLPHDTTHWTDGQGRRIQLCYSRVQLPSLDVTFGLSFTSVSTGGRSLAGGCSVSVWDTACCICNGQVETDALSLKPVLNWANVCSPNYDSFLNWTFSSPNMVRTIQTLLRSQLARNEMQASARTCGRRAADSLIQNVG